MQNHALESWALFNKSVLRYLSLLLFWVRNFDARYFFGSKISGLCILGGLQYEAPSDIPSCILLVPPRERIAQTGVQLMNHYPNLL